MKRTVKKEPLATTKVPYKVKPLISPLNSARTTANFHKKKPLRTNSINAKKK
jgi:hypothetical protein